jgi:hypothetical protein
LHDRLYVDGTKAGFRQNGFQFTSAGEGMFTALDPGGTRPEHPVERKRKGVRAGRPLDGAVDADCDPPESYRDRRISRSACPRSGKNCNPC